jgi:hypothetical protein
MAGPERIEWRRTSPSAALTVLSWYLAVALLGLALVWVLFGNEPARLDSGAVNPLALVPKLALGLALVGAVPFSIAVARRPVVAANHYALAVRPGALRMLVLPWAQLAGVAAYQVAGEPYLLVRCEGPHGDLGDHPGWLDQSVLRAALRNSHVTDRPVSEFDLAVRLRDFVGEPNALLATLAAFAPDRVAIATDITEDH